MKLFGKKSKDDAKELENNETRSAKDTIASLMGELNLSEKGGAFAASKDNSQYFNNVEEALSAIFNQMDEQFSGDMQKDWPIMQKIRGDYDKLIDVCQTYCKRISITKKGRARQSIVKRIWRQAEKDSASLTEYFGKMASLLPADRAKSLKEALDNSRRRVLDLPNEHKHLGGKASDVIRFKAREMEDGELTMKNVYFKQEESYQAVEKKGDKPLYRSVALDALAKAQEKYKIPMKAYEDYVAKLRKMPDNESSAKSFIHNLRTTEEQYNKDVSIHEFLDTAFAMADAHGALDNNFGFIGLNKPGKKINVSNRNVAASRLANLLGAGDLIVRSETATLRQSDGTEKKGILMQEAKGVQGQEARQKIIGDAYHKHMKDGKEEDFNGRENLKNAVTGEFQRSLADLQVLDGLMGQTDRHAGNYMTQMKDGKLTAVQGIDNDFSFGLNKLTKGVGLHGRSPVNEDGEMKIPYMSEQLKDAILAVTEEQIRFALQDVLEPEEIDACWKRVSSMQLAILLDLKNYETNGGTYRYLKDDQWGEDTLKEFMKDEGGYETYMGAFMRKAIVGGDLGKVKAEDLMKAAEQFWHDNGREFDFSNKSQTKAFLGVFVTEDKAQKALDYITDSGLLEKWCLEAKELGRGKAFDFYKLPDELRSQIAKHMNQRECLDKLDAI